LPPRGRVPALAGSWTPRAPQRCSVSRRSTSAGSRLEGGCRGFPPGAPGGTHGCVPASADPGHRGRAARLDFSRSAGRGSWLNPCLWEAQVVTETQSPDDGRTAPIAGDRPDELGRRRNSKAGRSRVESHEIAEGTREVTAPDRAAKVQDVLAAAHERDRQADIRDAAANRRDMTATLSSFLGERTSTEDSSARRASAIDRQASRTDRAASRADRAELAADDADSPPSTPAEGQ
jgi:hypothetical protein